MQSTNVHSLNQKISSSQRISNISNLRMDHSPFLPAILLLFLATTAGAAWAQQAPATPNAETDQSSSSAAQSPQPSGKAQDLLKPYLPKPGIDLKTMTPLYETIQEDWSSLQVGTSKLEPEKPLEASAEEQEHFKRYLVQLKWRPGDPIDLWIILPKNVTKPPAVLYLYNADQDTDRFRNNDWCDRVVSSGVGAVGFVSALSGHRFHDRPMKQWFVSELQESIGSTVHDVKFILDYLALRGDVDMNRIGMFGEGSGGAIAILAAVADPRIKAVDALDPWGYWPDFLAKSPIVVQDPRHDDYVKPEFLKKVAPLDPIKYLPDLKKPVRILQVQDSPITPVVCKDAIKAAAPKQAQVTRYESGSELGIRQGHGHLFQWIKDQLKEPANAGATLGNSVAAGKDPAEKSQSR